MTQTRTALEPADESQSHGGDTEIIALIELLFFAYRDFISDPDEILQDYGFGRAHHRVIHFVGRNPGMRVAELLDILGITKQSLARVLRELIEKQFVYQIEGENDRRRRLLYLTGQGEKLHARLVAPQIARVKAALGRLPPEARAHYHDVLLQMIDKDDRDHVLSLIREKQAVADRR